MGWASGSSLAERIWQEIKDCVPAVLHQEVALSIVEGFLHYDADDWADCEVYETAYATDDEQDEEEGGGRA